MKLVSLGLENFRGISSLELKLDKSLTLIAGINGAGKSTILDAIAILLSWIPARTRSKSGSGKSISDLQVQNTRNATRISARADNPDFDWQIVKTKAGRKTEDNTNLSGLNEFTLGLRDRITETEEQCSIPLFAYYPVNRAVLDIPLRIKTPHKFSLLAAWDESLTSTANFRRFFEWFRQREDLENENRAYLERKKKPEDWEFPDRQLTVVRKAWSKFLPEFKDFKVHRNPLRMTAFKKGEELIIDQLSDGEKCMMALVGDLARRLAIANPIRKNPLLGEGIVLIDEFDLHLHPAWQRRIIRLLPEVFKNCQFIVTTHSPQALGEVQAEQLRILYRDKDNQIQCRRPEQSFGLTSNNILNEIMLSEGEKQLARNPEVEQTIYKIFQLIDKEDFKKAQKLITELESELKGDIPELVGAKTRMSMLGWDDE